jgi:catechol 2,3-dioxygenase-like lactoylglutathione lyase family enzyme
VTVEHTAVNVSDWERAKRFYEELLGTLGYRIVYEEDGVLAYFADHRGLDFGIGRREPTGGAHVAFACHDRDAVDQFYEAGMAAGGRDNGAPGLRPQYDANYYAAYVLDPDGNNIEGVCHHAPT